MFRKLKDKIAEEVKSSPSRIQQLAQVAQVKCRHSSTKQLESNWNERKTIGNFMFRTSKVMFFALILFAELSLKRKQMTTTTIVM